LFLEHLGAFVFLLAEFLDARAIRIASRAGVV
jgi:hypothetical protein